jgi:hypothetical protein
VLAGAVAAPEVLAGQLLAVELEADAVDLVLHAQQEQLQQDEDDWVSTYQCLSSPVLCSAAAALVLCCACLAVSVTCGA